MSAGWKSLVLSFTVRHVPLRTAGAVARLPLCVCIRSAPMKSQRGTVHLWRETLIPTTREAPACMTPKHT